MILPFEKIVEEVPSNCIFISSESAVEKLKKVAGEKMGLKNLISTPPSGVAVAKLGLEKFKKNQIEDLSNLEPLYVSKVAFKTKKYA